MRSIAAVLLLAQLIQLAQSQAPFDSDSFCTTSTRFQSQRDIIPDDHFVLLDSYTYTNLLGNSRSRWATSDLDADGQTWQQTGGLCQLNLRVSTCPLPSGSQSNWLFTQYVSYEDAQEITFDFSYRLSAACPTCEILPVTVYRFDTTGIQNPDTQLDPSMYTINMGALEQVGRTDNSLSWIIPRPSDSAIKGFYLAFEDVGTCGQLQRMMAYHRIAPGFRDARNLVTCANTPLPPIGSEDITTTTCTCDVNSITTTGLQRTCDSTGQCTTELACACIPGYELSSDGTCTVCPPGTFKATVSNTDKCTPCPLNSQALFEGTEVCECNCGTVRPNDQPAADCSSPPSSPQLANNNPLIESDDGITIFWLPAANDGGSPETLHYNVFTFDPSTQKYIRQNSFGVIPIPGEELVQFTISGLNQYDSVSVVVTSASAATGDFNELESLSAVQNRFIAFYATLNNPSDSIVPDIIIDVGQEGIPDSVVVPEEIIAPEPVVITVPELPTVIVDIATEPEITTPEATTQEVATTEAPTEMPKQFFTLGDMVLNNGSSVSLASIAEADNALHCHTDDEAGCCQTARAGEFYYPNGALVPVRALGQSVFRNRGAGFIRLNNTGRSGTPLGQYRCEIPDSTGQLKNLFITITA